MTHEFGAMLDAVFEEICHQIYLHFIQVKKMICFNSTLFFMIKLTFISDHFRTSIINYVNTKITFVCENLEEEK